MRMYSTLSVLLATSISLTASTRGNTTAPQANTAESLVGTWRLLVADDRLDAKSPWEHSYGKNPLGYFVYDNTGHVFIQFCTNPPTPPFSAGDFQPTAHEAESAYLNYVAYFGTYTVDAERHIVTHHVEGSLLPSYTATDQVRPYHLHGEYLELGDGKTWRRVLVRVPPPNQRLERP